MKLLTSSLLCALAFVGANAQDFDHDVRRELYITNNCENDNSCYKVPENQTNCCYTKCDPSMSYMNECTTVTGSGGGRALTEAEMSLMDLDEVERHEAREAEKQRRLQQFSVPTPVQNLVQDPAKLPYRLPCFGPNRATLNQYWTKWDNVDDGSVLVNISFTFQFFDNDYTSLFIADNGIITFQDTFRNNYQPSNFPQGLRIPMIAPFWADVETAGNGNKGDIWYRDFGDFFAVIWDEVGYYTNGTDLAKNVNSFQVVIAKTDQGPTPRLPDLANICFCYLDMGWTHGEKVGGIDGFGDPTMLYSQFRSATVGVTSGLSQPFGATQYSQIGRFNETKKTFRGITTPSGVDFLDDLGSERNLGAEAGFCFKTSPNIAPSCIGGPDGGIIAIPACQNLPEFKFFFQTPEIDQALDISILAQPAQAPQGLSLTFDGGGMASATGGVRFEWLNIDYGTYGGQNFTFTFEACDNAQEPLCVRKTVVIVLSICANPDNCYPEKCNPIDDVTCPLETKPVCYPWRSKEHCDAMYSFTTLIMTRHPMIRASLEGADMMGDAGWWYHYTDDRAGAYSYTRFMGEAAPELLCCVTSENDLLGTPGNTGLSQCFGGTTPWLPGTGQGYVLRAEGHHSGQGVLVFPNGIDPSGGPNVELITGTSINMASIRVFLQTLIPTPTKILVEKYISGSTTAQTLPDEYKFHMFDGKIGSISIFKNKGTDCGCYAEYDEDWVCLHKHGCFSPNLPYAQYNQYDSNCYDIGWLNGTSYPVKGYGLCDKVPKPPDCLFNELKRIAKKLSEGIKVYVRIDFFVTDDYKIYVQEYTYNHLGGSRHCAARETASGCIDSCFLGKCWADNGGVAVMGGPQNPVTPTVFQGPPTGTYGDYTHTQQCATAMGQTVATVASVCPPP